MLDKYGNDTALVFKCFKYVKTGGNFYRFWAWVYKEYVEGSLDKNATPQNGWWKYIRSPRLLAAVIRVADTCWILDEEPIPENWTGWERYEQSEYGWTEIYYDFALIADIELDKYE